MGVLALSAWRHHGRHSYKSPSLSPCLCCDCSAERSAGRLLRDAASLLLYREALQGPPAQALLRLLLLIRRSDGEADCRGNWLRESHHPPHSQPRFLSGPIFITAYSA